MKTMTDALNRVAATLGWEVHESPSQASYLRGDTNIQVDFSDAGSVLRASLYHFHRIDDLRLVDEATGKFKREKILAWLAED